MPDFDLERSFGADDGRIVIGLDEAGRGPWAGPVVAGAAWLDPLRLPPDLLAALDDSKTLSAAARARLFEAMTAAMSDDPASLRFATGHAEVEEIDALNILQASLLSMRRAGATLTDMLPTAPSVALVDGNRRPDLPCRVETVIKGDGRSLTVAAASIAAKVVRDREMDRLATAFPGYGWERNRGYGTAEHRAALADLGVTPQHRRTFRPVRECLVLST